MNDELFLTILVRDSARFLMLRDLTEWDALTMAAAVSSDPRSIHELSLAWQRYESPEAWEELPWENAMPEEVEQHWLLIDLANLSIATDLPDFLPETRAQYTAESDSPVDRSRCLWINIPPTWKQTVASNLAAMIRPIGPPVEALDFRGVLFGRPLIKFIAKQMSQRIDEYSERMKEAKREAQTKLKSRGKKQAKQNEVDVILESMEGNTASSMGEISKQIHAKWLMTPRKDLGGKSPRFFLHEGRSWADLEVDSRREQWSLQRRPPRALDRETHTYRFGPMTIEEVVLYFEMVRGVINDGWRLILVFTYKFGSPPNQSELGKMLWDVLKSMMNFDDESLPATPAKIIESSRRHMPILDDGVHIDCNCQNCTLKPLDVDEADFSQGADVLSADVLNTCTQNVEENRGTHLMFSMTDGHHLELEGEFAFSLCESREEWEEMEGCWADEGSSDEEPEGEESLPEATSECGAEVAVKEPIAPRVGLINGRDKSIWKNSFVAEELLKSLGGATLALAYRLAELAQDLVTDKVAERDLEHLNTAFHALRKSAMDKKDPVSAARELKRQLDRLSQGHPKFLAKFSDLLRQVDAWLRLATN